MGALPSLADVYVWCGSDPALESRFIASLCNNAPPRYTPSPLIQLTVLYCCRNWFVLSVFSKPIFAQQKLEYTSLGRGIRAIASAMSHAAPVVKFAVMGDAFVDISVGARHARWRSQHLPKTVDFSFSFLK